MLIGKKSPKYALLSLTLVALVLSLTGCQNDTGKTEVAGPSLEERIQQIESKTDMPPQAKAIAIQQLKDRESQGKAEGEARKEKN